MALPATDSFTGTDGTALDTYSSNWTTEGGAFDIQSNALASNQASTRTMARWNADTFDDAQYAQGTLVNMTQSGRYIGVATRVASGANNGYHYLFTSTGGWFLLDVTGGSGSVVASGTESSPAGKVIRLESNGDQHECIYDGSPVTGSPFTNASYSSGSAGVSGYHDSASNRLDDWEGGNLGGTAYTLTAAQGSYTLSGQTAGVLATRTLSAGQGSYSLTGQAAGVRRGLRLAAGHGSYGLTGQSAGITAARVLAAAQGAYSLTGEAATLTWSGEGAKTLTAAQGSYSLTGQAAGIEASRSLAAGQGSYALTGQSAALALARALVAAQGSYTLTGQAAVIDVPKKVIAESGAYTITGQDVNLLYTPAATGGLSRRRLRRRYRGYDAKVGRDGW